MSDAVWWVDENGSRRFKTRRSVARLHPDWTEADKPEDAPQTGEQPPEQAETDKPARKGATKRS